LRGIARAVTVGLILAMASSAIAASRFPQAKDLFAHNPGGAIVMRVSDGQVLSIMNHAVARDEAHPPGSIFKLVTAFAALRESVVTESSTFKCGGTLKIDGRVFHCTRLNGHGALQLPEAIAQSCNCTFYNLGLKLGSKRLLEYARAFGFQPAYRGYSKKQPSDHLLKPPSNPIDTARLAIGQAEGFSITLLEAAEMVRRIVRDDVHIPGADRASIRRALAIVRKSMRLAVVKGTCRNAAPPGLAVAGKTGSPEAEGDSDERSGWFVGYAPYQKPQVIVVVFVNRGHGFSDAAPIARHIFADYFGIRK